MTTTFTRHFRWGLPDFDVDPWHDDWYTLVNAMDRTVYDAMIATGATMWANSTQYDVGNIVISPDDGSIWVNSVSHTSAASPTTFLADRVAHPTFWNEIPQGGGGGGGAPTDAEYIVSSAHPDLDAERVATNGTSIVWDFATPGVATAKRAALTGDITAALDDNVTTLATVNGNVGTFGSATQVGQFTVNAKGLITAAAAIAISLASSAITDFNEAAQDAVGGILTDSSRIDFTYNDGANTITADIIANSVGDSHIRQSLGLSVIGRSANTTGNVADIVAASDGQVLRRSGTAIGFGAVDLASANAITGDLPFANLTQGTARSVLGVTGNATADNASIQSSATNQVLNSTATTVVWTATPTVTSLTLTTLTVGTSSPFSDSAGTLTLQNVDVLDATTESTIEAAIDTLANLTSVQGRTVTLADPNLDVIFGWDDSGSAYKNFALADILTEGSPAAGDFVLIYGAEGDLRKVDWSGLPGAGGGAPTTAQYITLATDGTLTQERVLTPGAGLTGTDGGAGSTYTLAVGAGTGITVNADDVALDTAHARNKLHPVSTDNAVARYDGTTGDLQNSLAIIDDNGTIFGFVTAISTGMQLTYQDATAAIGPILTLFRDSASPAIGDGLGFIGFGGRTSTAASATYGQVYGIVIDPTNATFAGQLVFGVATAGAMTDELVLRGDALFPNANGGLSLGLTGLGYSELFLASGGVIHWASTDVLLSHSTNTLSFTGATNGYFFDASLGMASGTAINWNGGDVLITHATDQLSVTGANNILFNTTSPLSTTVDGVSVTPFHQIHSTGATASEFVARFSADTAASALYFAKSRNAAIGSHTIVNDADQLGRISFAGSDGTDFAEAARIDAVVNGTPANNAMPGMIRFRTSPSGGQVPANRLTIAETLATFTVNLSTNGYMDFTEIASPANPAADVARLFAKDVAGVTKLFIRDSAGTETDLGAAGAGSGDVVGPAGATDNAIARYDTATGKLLQDSAVTIDDNGTLAISTSASNNGISITYTDAGSGVGPRNTLFRDSATPTGGDSLGTWLYFGRTSTAATIAYAQQTAIIVDATNATASGGLIFGVAVSGAATDILGLQAGLLYPVANDGIALGLAGTNAFSDLFLAEGGVINWDNGDVTLTQTGNSLAVAGGEFVVAAGTTAEPALRFATGGSLMTTPSDGAIEMDADCFYGCTDAGNRGYIPVRHFIRADSTRTFTSNTNEQAIFTSPTNGRITLETGCYKFEGMIFLTAMSATSGNITMDIVGAGTVTASAWAWQAFGQDIASGQAGAAIGGSWQVAAQSAGTNLVTAAVGTAMAVWVAGTFEVTGAGTVIPSLTMVTASASVVSIGSYMMFERIGSTSVVSVGQWD